MKRTLVVLAALLAFARPSLAQVGQQPGVSQPPFTGGAITTGLSAPTGCSSGAMGYGFSVNPTAGVCAVSSTSFRFTTGNVTATDRAYVTLSNSVANTPESALNAADQSDNVSILTTGLSSGLGYFNFNGNGGVRFLVDSDSLLTSFRTTNTQTAVFSLDTEVASGNVFQWTDVSAPTKLARVSQATDTVALALFARNGVNDTDSTVRADENYVQLRSDSSDGSVNVEMFLNSDGTVTLDSEIGAISTAVDIGSTTTVIATSGADSATLSLNPSTTEAYLAGQSATGYSAAVALADTGVKDITNGTKPTCGASYRGYRWLIIGGGGVGDNYEVCLKGKDGVYTWSALAQTEDPRTIDDNAGGTPATLSLTPDPGAKVVSLTCSDADGCEVTLTETDAVAGRELTIIQIVAGSGNVTLIHSAGVANLDAGANVVFTGAGDVVRLMYVGSAWQQIAPLYDAS